VPISIDKKKTALLVMDCENDLVHQDGVIAKAMGYAPMIEKNGTLGHIRTVLEAAGIMKSFLVARNYLSADFDLEQWLNPEPLREALRREASNEAPAVQAAQ